MIYRATLLLFSSAVASADFLRTPDRSILDNDTEEDMEFCFEKGIRCSGGDVKHEILKFGKKCEGGLKFCAHGKTKPEKLVESISDGLHEHLQEGYLPRKDGFMPTKEEMQQILEMEDGLSSIEEGREKNVVFGGFLHVNWSCNATYEKSNGITSKKVECALKSSEGGGKNETKIDVGDDGTIADDMIPDINCSDDILDNDTEEDMEFCSEKGIRCSGGGVKHEKFDKKCEGGLKFIAHGKTKPEKLVESISDGLHEHLQEGYLPRKDRFMPTKEEMQQILEMEDGLSSIEDASETSVVFGGFLHVDWGCKAALKKEGGKFLKNVDCGVKSFQGAGNKDKEATIDVASA